MTDLCDSQDARSTRTDLPGLALFARARHVREQLARLLVARAELMHGTSEVLLVRGELAPLLRQVSEQLTYTQRQDARAAPWDGQRVDYAGAAGLELWAERLETPWFGVVARSLRFDLQSIAALDGGLVHGFEALVRGRLGEREIGAAALLQAAAAHNQVAIFDARARKQAILQAYPQLPAGARLFVNLSPTAIYDPDICLGATFRACVDADVDIGRLVFEITGTHSFPDLTLLRRILERCRDAGARVALEDMGSGHTSLRSLSTLRPDYLKLDRGLVSGLHHGDPRLPLLAAMIRHAHDLGVLVVARGVETTEELQLVRELGVDLGQGYFLGRPSARPSELATAARNALGGGISPRRPEPVRRSFQPQPVPVEF